MNSIDFSFIHNSLQKSKTYNVLIPNSNLNYLLTHFRFSSLFYSLQLVDIFAYEVLSNKTVKNVSSDISTVVVYNFHSLYTQDRFFIFTSSENTNNSPTNFNQTSNLSTVSELFPAANWLEREVSELHGLIFLGKKDLRNLMLQYGDSSSPFQKSFPTIGTKEMYYEPLKDTLIQNPISVQL